MNLVINQSLAKFILAIAIIALLAKIASLPLYFLLPHFGINKSKEYTINIYHKYNLSRAFGIIPTKTKKEPAPKKPVYQLTNLKLKAIYSEGKDGVIAIEEKGNLIFLATGETFKGYKLIEVKPDRAIFEKDGKHYELKLEEQNLKGKYIQPTSSSLNPDEVKFAVLKRDIKKFKKNFNEIWKNISIQEQIDPKTKKLAGFKVTHVNKNSIFGKIGLKEGDIIIGANNQKFKSYSDVLKLYNNIDKYNSIKISIIRNNQKKDLEYEIY
ncbi:MAG: PDZ domain-containing protein [Epsilonproteobacteria bacterium]|nr:PDZ domain-containing protein [Campylobacterota bacterium]